MLLITINTSYWALVLQANMSLNPYSSPRRRQLPHLWTKHGGSKGAVTQLREHEVGILTLQFCSLHPPSPVGTLGLQTPRSPEERGQPGCGSQRSGDSPWSLLLGSLVDCKISSYFECSCPYEGT